MLWISLPSRNKIISFGVLLFNCFVTVLFSFEDGETSCVLLAIAQNNFKETSNPTETQAIVVGNAKRVTVKSLVRARLLEEKVFILAKGIKDEDLLNCTAEPIIEVTFYDQQNTPIETKVQKLSPGILQHACLIHSMGKEYHDDGKGDYRTGPSGSGFWPEVDAWETLSADFLIPENTIKLKIRLEARKTNAVNYDAVNRVYSDSDILESYLFYRPDYKLVE